MSNLLVWLGEFLSYQLGTIEGVMVTPGSVLAFYIVIRVLLFLFRLFKNYTVREGALNADARAQGFYNRRESQAWKNSPYGESVRPSRPRYTHPEDKYDDWNYE